MCKNIFKKINPKELLLMLMVVFLAGFGGNLLMKPYWYLGIFLLLISFGLEFFLLTKLDMRDDVKQSKDKIIALVEKAEESNKEIEKTKKEIDETVGKIKEMKEKVFGWHEPLFTVRSLSDDINEIKKILGMSNYGWIGSSSTMKERIDGIEGELKEIKRAFRRR